MNRPVAEDNLASDLTYPPNLPCQYKLGELFAGAGGMALGARQATLDGSGFSLSRANDIDQDACNTLISNFPIAKESVHCCPVEDFEFDALLLIDGLCFGFQCNDFSVVNERKGISGHYGGLYKWGGGVTGSGGGETHIYHWQENRALTNRERARSQSFPDWFVFSGGKESVRKQIGMAVPPKGAEAVFRQVLATLLSHAIKPC